MDVVPGDVMSICEGIVSRSELYYVSGVVISVVELITLFVFFHYINEGSAR